MADAVAEVRPVFASLAHTVQPFLAFVLTVVVRGVGLLMTLPVLSVPSASLLPLSANENVEGTDADTETWSPVTLAVLKPELSMVVGVLVCVVMVPVLELVALDLIVTAALLTQLKQYSVPTVRSPLGKVTAWLVTFVAVAMLGHAVPPVGQARLVVLTVKLAAVPSVYPVGKVTITLASVAVDVGLAQMVPVVAVLTCMRSKRTMDWLRSDAYAGMLSKIGIADANSRVAIVVIERENVEIFGSVI